MPMENNLQLDNLMKEGTFPVESVGGDRWRILHGDTLQLVQAFQPGIFDALITDPPYASGGTKQNERNRTTNQKYSSMRAENALPDFDGDNKDQRSWTHWMAEWLYDARKACKKGAPICLFIDWRQYPSITDALQWAGWIWRGTAVWDKGNSRPQKGRFRQQAEYIVWGSNGPMPVNRPVSCLLERHTGARALRAILEEYMLDIMYEIPKDDNIGEVVITEGYIQGNGGPKILMRGQETPLIEGRKRVL